MAGPDARILDEVHAVVESRRDGDPAASHTAALFARGRGRIAQKVGEEAVETVIAAMQGDRAGVVGESTDLLYHLTVLWAEQGIAPAEVWAELGRRFGRSGIAEKAARVSGNDSP